MNGRTITIIRYETTGDKDPTGRPVAKPVEETVDDVLVAPGSQSNATDSTRPDGVTVAFTLHLPRSYTVGMTSLRGAHVRIDDAEYEVIGDPHPYDGGLKPTRWNLQAEVTDTRG